MPFSLRRWFPWLVRAAWVVLPVTVGPSLSSSLAESSTAVRFLALGLAWSGWSAGLLATLVPHPISLTGLRLLAIGVVAAAVWASARDDSALRAGLALVSAVSAAALCGSAATGEIHVNGPAYPNERRFLLRPPTLLALGPVPVAAAVAIAGPTIGPLLLAGRSWVLGTLLSVIGLPLAVLAWRALHALSRRFVVFVPAGFVISDASSLAEAQLFQRSELAGVGLAREGTGAYDLTGPTSGLLVEIALRRHTDVFTVRNGMIHAQALLIAPSRPGRFLAEARERRLADLPKGKNQPASDQTTTPPPSAMSAS